NIHWNSEETGGFDVRCFSMSDQITEGGMIRATRENDGWVFREDTLGAIVSRDARAIPVQLMHIRKTVAISHLPTAVPVEIHLVREKDNGYPDYHKVFSQLVSMIYDFDEEADPRKA
ncbi:MAG TPA: hypothetical protein VGP12_07320, partial [Nitrosospira sp.]|nr:hypothetical protein [Nitrosospira sp.]